MTFILYFLFFSLHAIAIAATLVVCTHLFCCHFDLSFIAKWSVRNDVSENVHIFFRFSTSTIHMQGMCNGCSVIEHMIAYDGCMQNANNIDDALIANMCLGQNKKIARLPVIILPLK